MVTVEAILVAVVMVIGLIIALVALRDAVVSEVSDVTGSIQDVNQSFAVNGVTGSSSSVAGMAFVDSLDAGDDPDDLPGVADNGIRFDVPPTNESNTPPTVETFFGHPTTDPLRRLDTWRSNLVIDEGQTWTNDGSEADIDVTDFTFHAGRNSGIVTPFIVKVLGDNSFVVVAVGDTVTVSATGEQTHPFAAAATSINVLPGETLAFGFTDARADGSGGNRSVVRWNYTNNEIWYSGGPGANHSAAVSVGSAPTPGRRILTNQRRDYQFRIGLQIPTP